jgi:hypothetical protein
VSLPTSTVAFGYRTHVRGQKIDSIIATAANRYNGNLGDEVRSAFTTRSTDNRRRWP